MLRMCGSSSMLTSSTVRGTPGSLASCMASLLCLSAALILRSPQLVQQCPGLTEVSRVKPLGEPIVDRRQQVARFLALALLLPQPAQAQCRPQLERLGLLSAGHGEGLVEKWFGGHCRMLHAAFRQAQ